MVRRIVIVAAAFTLFGCAGATLQGNERGEEFIEVPNPGATMSQNAPDTIWVPRRYVEKGVPRGTQLVKDGYQALQGGTAPRAPEPGSVPGAPEPAEAGVVQAGGAAAKLVPHYGMVVAVDHDRIFFNLGKQAGLRPGQTLKIYRGGTVVEGLGLAPGQEVTTIQVAGFVGTNGGFGMVKQGTQVQKNDLVGTE
jgi:hypothetical protein